jgi:hypothetical protein
MPDSPRILTAALHREEDKPPVLGHVDGLAVPHPGQHLARVVAQVPEAHGMWAGSRHGVSVIQICGYK